MFEKKVGRPSNETVKKRRIFKVSMFLLAVAVVASVVGGLTYARYRTTSTANGTVDIAQWNVALKNGSGQVLSSQNKVTITPIASEQIDTGKIAPGSQFQIQYQIDPTGSEVAVETSFTTLKVGFVDIFGSIGNSAYNDSVMTYGVISASYTIDGVTTPITLSDYIDPAPLNLTYNGQPYMTIPFTYTYPTTPIKIPLSKIQAGKGLTTVTIIAAISDTELDASGNYYNNYSDYNDSTSNGNIARLLGIEDFQIKLVAAQDTGDNYLSTRSNLPFDFFASHNIELNPNYGS